MNKITRFTFGMVLVSAVWGRTASAAAEDLSSPNGSIRVAVEVRDAPDGRRNCLFWSVAYRGKTIIDDSALGLKLKDAAALDRGFSILAASRSSHDSTWKPVYGERSEIRDAYNSLQIDLRDDNDPPRRMQLRLRAYDEGVALCHAVPEQDALREFVIESEDTRFGFRGDHPAWAVYSAQGRYEATTLDRIRPNCERPLTVRVSDDLYVAVAEARLVDYARMRLGPVPGKRHALVSMLAGTVKAAAPFAAPWRVILIGESPGQLLERNSLFLNLNEPCAIKDTSWIRPGKVIREVTLTTAGGKACVDFAVRQGLQYIEYDAGWYGPENDDRSDATTVDVDPQRSRGPLDLAEVIRYANQKGIGVWLYVNRRALERQLDEILPLYQRWGVRGVKFGFVQVGSQPWTRWLHEAIRKAADHQLLVDVHDEYRPTGFERTYPNFLTMEGIGGNETMPPAEQDLIYPFTRYLCGPADYTICWYNDRVKNTRAHQLAAAVVYYSPLQFVYWYDRPDQFGGEPEAEFLRFVPTVWDDTRVLHGRIGETITVARRRRADWFVGSMNAVERRQVDIPLSFLPAGQTYQAEIYQDRNPRGTDRHRVDIRLIEVDCQDTLIADMAANGGQAIRLTPKPEPEAKTEPEPALHAPVRSEPETKPVYLFSYFKGNGEDGLHLAYSRDGYRWEPLNQDRPYLAPAVGGKLMRDPCIRQGPDGTFHLVFTSSWSDRGIGYAYSRDLIHWSPQRFIPVMEHEPGALNCWAPEWFYDEAEKQYLIFWATTIPGRFGETDNQDGGKYNHRMYCVTTKDFVTFSETRLFYDQGFNVIDATIVRDDGRCVMICKDETNLPFTPQKNLRLAFADRAAGPYGQAGGPITGDYWCEGPSAIRIADEWIVYFDKYRKHAYGAVASGDLEHWRDISQKVAFPRGARHGTVFTVLEAVLENLQNPPDFLVDADYPGGNILIERIEGDTVYCAPDNRDTRGGWFYWNFRVRQAAAKTLTFQFVGTDPLGVRGPAFSGDQGKTWSWLGEDAVKGRSFSYTFADADEVRFAFAVPYTQSDLQRFLADKDSNPHLRIETLCRTRGGRNCLRLHVGTAGGAPKHRLLLTCRHHACETMASFVLEGALDCMLSDTETGRWFRQNAEVLAIPFMDTDGVEDGDQGKNRIPHDHNRDYDGASIYPAVAALREFVPDWSLGRLHAAVDLHCPHIRGPNNEVIYQVGNANPSLWAEQVKLATLLETEQTGPLTYAASDDMTFGKSWNTAAAAGRPSRFRLWAGRMEGIKLATTFEIPYANAAGREVNADSGRAFGRDLAEALRRYLETLP
ncbi:MAG: glycoside hydrolase family 97 N-terminal domain-containing protein [Sedimentisphaerales bacterium]|nr:glycoside hydrolase family 97 N-terminal domain-containing protein [Sedimentisphaerales bacterium]